MIEHLHLNWCKMVAYFPALVKIKETRHNLVDRVRVET